MQILHRPLSHDYYPARASNMASGLVAEFKEIFPHAEPGILDLQSWIENTAMMLALREEANRNGARFQCLNAVGAGAKEISAACEISTPPQDPCAPDTVMWGFFHKCDGDALPVPANLIWNSREAVGRINRWAETGILQSMAGADFAGRHYEVVEALPSAVRQSMSRLRKAGHHYATLKSAGSGWVHFLDLSQDIPEDLETQITAVSEPEERLVLHTMIEPTYEYRMFIVGDEVVTGSGCIDELTPLDHIGMQLFDLRMVRHQDEGLPAVEISELTVAYVKFAQEFASQWAKNVSGETSYALDLCWDNSTKKIVPMDLNPLVNVSLYASSPQLLAKALCSAAH